MRARLAQLVGDTLHIAQSANQKDDLASQKKAMEQFCLGAGIAVDEWIDETGSGMNFKRKKFLDLMTRIGTGEIEQLIIAHQDRLSRFGFDYFEHYATSNGCDIVVANQQSLSPEQEMIEDLLTGNNGYKPCSFRTAFLDS